MGSGLCSQQWVADRLQKTTRTIRNYVARGVLKEHKQGGHPMYDRDEVEELAHDLGTDYPVMNRKSFFELLRRVKKLEQDMSVVRRAMEIGSNPLRPSAAAAVGYYRAAINALAAADWSGAEIEVWAEQFDRLDETALETIGQAAVVDRPWEPFFRLCMAQMEKVAKDPSFENNLQLQLLHKKLDEGRKKLRGSILVWIEMQKGNPTEQAVQLIEEGLQAVKNRLSGN